MKNQLKQDTRKSFILLNLNQGIEMTRDEKIEAMQECIEAKTALIKELKDYIESLNLSPNPWKEPELMTVSEVLRKAKVNDIIFHDTGIGVPYKEVKITPEIHSQAEPIPGLKIDEITRPMWLIKSEEPKVLSVEEIQTRVCKESKEDFHYNDDDIFKAIELSAENQWLNHKELREAVEKVIKAMSGNSYDEKMEALAALENVYKNLKPIGEV
jgi:hypothetical protein